jgi:hypothetical protein
MIVNFKWWCAGWSDWAIFHQLGYIWRLIIIFWKDEVAPSNDIILGYFLLKQIYYIFTQIDMFKTWFVASILRFQKWLDVDILDFQFELCNRYFGIFWFRDFWGYFLKNWAIFSQNFWSPWCCALAGLNQVYPIVNLFSLTSWVTACIS